MRRCMAGFFNEWATDFRSTRPFLIWVVLTLIVGAAGPFGTYHALPLMVRIFAWALVMAVAIVFATGVRALVHGGFGLRSFSVGSMLIAFILAAVFPPVVHLIIHRLPETAGFGFPGMKELAIYVFCTSLGVGAYRHATGQIDTSPKPAVTGVEAEAQPPRLPRLIGRLPVEVQAPLISISVRDHYIDVTTRRGQASLLLRLSDAVAETDADDGVQVHRSHWVAWDAIRAVEHKGTRMVLQLDSGVEVPVSRTYRTSVEERGIGITRTM